ncbi:hypothetical protein NTE_03425 [Candidatus Nitrososphaera evergladensis SR1]|uniref:Uncharacterized protein n=1 Tax=Candidatus Nitrososphaera evergladensis SR1 TaxID=1459636 RepID=A0A075MWE4_9ARCH|nr:hypothetical protein [Candidatus Nitrososphaera evergladensis]AIF85453.1 hypothetical protein NTE_03425 [Candidatus Nitrososphaera evergladensis SR1]
MTYSSIMRSQYAQQHRNHRRKTPEYFFLSFFILKDMYLVKTRRKVIVTATLAAIATTALFLYYYFYVNYAQLTLRQIPPNQISTTMPFMEISQKTVDHTPVLARAIREVTIKYDRATQDCPARQLVLCDIPSATRYTTGMSIDEYEYLRDSGKISFKAAGGKDSSNNDAAVRETNIKYRCSHANLADATFEEYCYYTLKVERTPANWFG